MSTRGSAATFGSDQLHIVRRGPLERVHLHYAGTSSVETRRSPRVTDGNGDRADVNGADASTQGDDDVFECRRGCRIDGVDRAREPVRSSSWVDVRPGFLTDPSGVLASVRADTPWAQGETWRYERYVEEQRLGAMIRDGDQNDALRQTGMHLRGAYQSPLSGVAAILYRNGRDFQGLHSDRSMKWLDNTLIAILVVGERRPFVLRPRRALSNAERLAARSDGSDSSEDVTLYPGHGDLIVLGGRSQRDWLHGVPACDVKGERISLTWRWTSRTGEPDPGPVYGEGVHYSDATSRPFRRTRRV